VDKPYNPVAFDLSTCPVERTGAQINYGELLRMLSFLHASVNLPEVCITHIVARNPAERDFSNAQPANKMEAGILFHKHSYA
jgi:hypothetical protein